MKFEKAVDTIVKYINTELYPAMKLNDWQEIIYGVVMSRMSNAETMKHALASNGFMRFFAIVDSEGNIDIDGLLPQLQEQIAKKGSLTITLPLMPTLTFHAQDIETLKRYIAEAKAHENN